MRSRDVWAEVAPRGRHPRRASRPRRGGATAGGGGRAGGVPGHRDGRRLRAADRLQRRRDAFPMLRADGSARRAVEPARAAGRIARRRSRRSPAGSPRRMDVTFMHETPVRAVEPPTDRDQRAARSQAERCVVCPGDDLLRAFPDRLAAYGLTRCKLHMLRVAAAPGLPRFTAAVMSDLGLVRYLGYAELPEAAALQAPARAGAGRASGQRRPPDRGAERGRLAGRRRLRTTTPPRPIRSRPTRSTS